MSRADDLRAELTALEDEENALARLREVREEYRNGEAPKSLVAEAARAVRSLRAETRSRREGSVTVAPPAVGASVVVETPGMEG